MDSELEAFLEHYGVKGQKWGVRRNKPAPGRLKHMGAGKKAVILLLTSPVGYMAINRLGTNPGGASSARGRDSATGKKNPLADLTPEQRSERRGQRAVGFIVGGPLGLATVAAVQSRDRRRA